jgi:ribA/ribD-fused uncharacterized protein
MDTSSYFIKNRCLFGSYPKQEAVDELEENGVRYFIDLTMKNESLTTPYTTKYNYINYPIVDKKVPSNWRDFAKFILSLEVIIKNLGKVNSFDLAESGAEISRQSCLSKELCSEISQRSCSSSGAEISQRSCSSREQSSEIEEKMYIHCKGGHGRSGVVVASILCQMGGISPQKSLELTRKYHSRRKVMREKWREIGSPQTSVQKTFVYKFFEPFYFYRAYKTGNTIGMSNFSEHKVETKLGIFPSSEAAFQAFKDPENEEYVNNQKEAKTPVISKYMGRKCNLREDWSKVKDEIMLNVVRLKFEQNKDIRENLLNTGLRILIEKKIESKLEKNTERIIEKHVENEKFFQKEDSKKKSFYTRKDFLECTRKKQNGNLGEILTKIRNEFYQQ